MAIRATTAQISKVFESDRFEPRYYIIYNKFEEYEKNSKFKIVRLGDKRILKKITDGEHAGQIFVEKGIRFVKNSAVRDFNIDLLDDFFITEEKHKQQKRSALKPLDILFTTIGHLGSCVIVPDGFGEANINQNVVKIEIDSNFIDPYYLAVYLNSNITKKQIFALFTGNIHSILTYPKIKDIRIIIPDKDFVNKMSNKYKDSIEKEREAFKLIGEAKDIFYKNCKIDFTKIPIEKNYSKMLSDFDSDDLWTPRYSYPRYVNTLKEIQKKWETIPLGTLAMVKKGDEVGSENYNLYLEKKENDTPFIRTTDLVNYEIDQFPDYFVPVEIYREVKQNLAAGDIIFTKDGKIGMTGMITQNDRAIICSGISSLRLKDEAKKYNLTPEYLFLVLSLKETGLYPAIRRTVIASTLPHLREERLKEFEIPILDKNSIDEITKLVKEAFKLKNEKKKLIKEVRLEIDKYFKI